MNEYLPDKVAPPGDTLQELLDDRKMLNADLAKSTGLSDSTIIDILKGSLEITGMTAVKLARAFGLPEVFWLQLEENYRESLRRHRMNRKGT